ncbi:MAG: hypothetical protein RBR22_12830 [Desulfuromonas sp.]|nr:hypothetical protein [Desulfuromonas sp.]
MFRIVFIGLCSLMHLYLSWRITTMAEERKSLKRWIWIGSGTIWIIFSICLMLHLKDFNGNGICEWLWSQWVGSLFIMLWPLLIVDIITLGGRLSSVWHKRGLSCALAVCRTFRT